MSDIQPPETPEDVIDQTASQIGESVAQLGEGVAQAARGFTLRAPTGFPPGNPNHVGPDEADLRRRQTIKMGKTEAARLAWGRAGRKPGETARKAPGAKGAAPGRATDFDNVTPIREQVRPTSKGKDRKDVEKWSKSVQLAHMMLAMRLSNAEFAIDDEEAVLLTEAVLDVFEHYNIQIKGKNSAWAGLAYAVGLVYGPRALSLVVARLKSNPQPGGPASSTGSGGQAQPSANPLDPKLYQ